MNISTGLRKIAAAFATTALVTGAAAADSRGTIYYMAPTLFDEFQTESMNSIEAVFGSIGYEVRTLDGQNRSDVQLNQLDDILLLKPRAIILAAVDFDSVIPGIEKARAADVPVFAYDRQITSVPVDFTSVAGTAEIGYMAAAEVSRLLRERHGDISGEVLQIVGDPGDSYTLEIQRGFDVRMKKHTMVRVVTKAAMQWEASNAGDIVEDQLLVNANIDLIFVHAAHLMVPVVAVLEAAGKKPGDILLVSSGGAPVGLQLIRKGWIQVEVEQPLYAQVFGMAMFAHKIIAGEKLVPGTYDVIGLKAALTEEKWGMNLKIPGAAVRSDNVDEQRFWGNLKPPKAPVRVVE